MPFLNPWMLLGLAGVSLPVIIHLLNRHRVQTIDWAAMELLRRVIQVKSRQLRLQDVVLMLLRCLAILLIVLAAARPTTHVPVKAADAGVVIGLDASYSMGYRAGVESRMDRAVGKVREILATVGSGRPVSLVLMGDRPRVLVRNASYDAAKLEEILKKVGPLAEGLNLERCLGEIEPLVREIKSPQREVYLVTDGQASSWRNLSDAARQELGTLGGMARVFVVEAEAGGQENLALVNLELASGSLRSGTLARYVAQVRNQGTAAREGGTVELWMDEVLVDRQTVGKIEAGQTVSVPLYAAFNRDGFVRLTARLGPDELAIDNVRYAAAQVRRTVRVLVVDGEAAEQAYGRATEFLTAALAPRQAQRSDASLEITPLSWMGLAGVQLGDYDVVILANVPDVPEEKVEALMDFVERGGGLMVFVGQNVRAEVLNKRLAKGTESLLPAELGEVSVDESVAAAGVPLDPALGEDALVSPLRSLPTDMLTECRFTKWMQARPRPQARVLLRLAASTDPVLVEQEFGRGKVLLFTSTADRKWNNMAINPLFPILMQQAVTFMTRVPAERGLLVNEPLVLPLTADLAGTTVKVTDPAGVSHGVTANLQEGEVAASWEETGQPGFYRVQAGSGPQGAEGFDKLSPGTALVAVNVNAGESDAKTLGGPELAGAVRGSGAQVLEGGQSVYAAVQEGRVGRELWYYLALGALAVMLIEGVLARWQSGRATEPKGGQGLEAAAEGAAA